MLFIEYVKQVDSLKKNTNISAMKMIYQCYFKKSKTVKTHNQLQKFAQIISQMLVWT